MPEIIPNGTRERDREQRERGRQGDRERTTVVMKSRSERGKMDGSEVMSARRVEITPKGDEEKQ